MVHALVFLASIAGAVIPASESKTSIQNIRIVAVSTAPAAGGTPAESHTYVLDTKVFGIILSTSVAYLDVPNTFRATQTITGNAFSVGTSSFVVTASSVGIRTTTPRAALDVNGSAQFGFGANRSTFSATGNLTLATGASLFLPSGSGKLGVGTLSTSYPAEIHSNVPSGSSWPQLALVNDSNYVSGLSLQSVGSAYEWLFYRYGSGNSDKFCFGINTLSEPFCAAVSGDITLTNKLHVGGSFDTDGGLISSDGSGVLTVTGRAVIGSPVVDTGDQLVVGQRLTIDGSNPNFVLRDDGGGLQWTSGLGGVDYYMSVVNVRDVMHLNSSDYSMGIAGTIKGEVGNSPYSTLDSIDVNARKLIGKDGAAVALDWSAGNVLVPSTVTIQGNQFSVGGSTFTINQSTVAIGGPYFSVGTSSFVVTGGSTTVGGLLHVGLTNTTTNACALATTCSVTCPANTYLLSGGCLNGTLTFGVSGSYPASITTWTCDSTGAVGITAYAICSRITR